MNITPKPDNNFTNADTLRLIDAWILIGQTEKGLREIASVQCYIAKSSRTGTNVTVNFRALDLQSHTSTYGTGKGSHEYYYSHALECALERAIKHAGVDGFIWDSSAVYWQNAYRLCEEIAAYNNLEPKDYYITRPRCGNI